MKRSAILSLALLCIAAAVANAQVKEDFVPAPNVQPGKQYPQVNSERCVRVRVAAPDAKSVKLDIGGFGSSVLRPILKDVPVVNTILPEPTEADEYVGERGLGRTRTRNPCRGSSQRSGRV